MNTKTIGLIVGGLMPAFMLAFVNIFAKASMLQGLGLGIYLSIIGAVIFLVGGTVYFFLPDSTLSLKASCYAAAVGFTWAIAISGISIAVSRFNIPISIIAPLANTNTLIAVIIGFLIFSEWQDVHMGKILAGSLLILIGGYLVAQS